MTKFVNRVLIAVVSFFPLLAALHSLEKDGTARTQGALLPLPSGDDKEPASDPSPTQSEDEGNATSDDPPHGGTLWIGYPRFATALPVIAPAEVL